MRKIIMQVREYLKMPTQEEFDAMIAEGFERQEREHEAWLDSNSQTQGACR